MHRTDTRSALLAWFESSDEKDMVIEYSAAVRTR